MARWSWLLVTLLGCTEVSRCRNHTMLLHLTLGGAAVEADQLTVTVTVDGKPYVNPPEPHKPGVASGNLEIDFQSGYPQGSSVSVDVLASLNGVSVGEAASGPITLAPGCSAAELGVGSSGDLAGAGDAAVIGDGALVDLTAVEHAPIDLAGVSPLMPDLLGIDLKNCVPTMENCFNGVDDDCDGLADCADPDCSGGASPQAVCVPDPGSFTAGTTVGATSACPSAWPSPTPISAGMSSTCDGSGCIGCNLISDWAQTDDCYVVLYDWGASVCLGGTGNEIRTSGVCKSISTIGGGDYHSIVGPNYEGFCSGSGGTSTKVASWGTNEKFCGGGPVGAGCNAGSMCVPAAPNHCVIKTGSQVACPTNYTLNTTRFYTSFDDSGRSCSCTCKLNGSGGCSGTPTVELFTGSDCTSAPGTQLNSLGCDASQDLSSFNQALATGVTVTSHASCSTSTSQTGSTALLGEQTVCCTP
jgi:hypothetical protein